MPDILTKADIDRIACTIEAMVELLERIRSPECFDQSEYYYLWRDAAQLLHTYHGTKGGDDDGK